MYLERGGGGRRGSTWVNFSLICATGLWPLPYPIIVYSVANYRPHLSHLGNYVIFAIPT